MRKKNRFSYIVTTDLILEFVATRCIGEDRAATVASLLHFIFILGEVFSPDSTELLVGALSPVSCCTLVCIILQGSVLERDLATVNAGEVLTS